MFSIGNYQTTRAVNNLPKQSKKILFQQTQMLCMIFQSVVYLMFFIFGRVSIEAGRQRTILTNFSFWEIFITIILILKKFSKSLVVFIHGPL